jgi:hypothetical protein
VKDRLLRRRRALITSPLEWQITAAPVPHPVIPVLAERGGTQLQTPRPTLLVSPAWSECLVGTAGGAKTLRRYILRKSFGY